MDTQDGSCFLNRNRKLWRHSFTWTTDKRRIVLNPCGQVRVIRYNRCRITIVIFYKGVNSFHVICIICCSARLLKLYERDVVRRLVLPSFAILCLKSVHYQTYRTLHKENLTPYKVFHRSWLPRVRNYTNPLRSSHPTAIPLVRSVTNILLSGVYR